MGYLKIKELVKQLREQDKKTAVISSDQYKRTLVALNRIVTSGKAEVHDFAEDITKIISGKGVHQFGGELVDRTFRSFGEWRGDRVYGFLERKLKRGDILITPAGIPHRTIPKEGIELIYLTTKNYLNAYWPSLDVFPPGLVNKLKNIKGVILDADGTMTDGKVWVNDKGEEFAAFSRVDSMSVHPWKAMGNKIGVISREDNSIIVVRAKKIKVDCVHGVRDKIVAAKEILEKWKLSFDQVAYIGDDVNDLEVMKKCTLSASPSDAQPQVLKIVDLVIPAKRGDHIIRKFFDLLLEVQSGKLPEKYE